MILGILLILAGAGAAIYGNSLNNDMAAQLESIFANGASNPGDIWLYAGIGVAVVGLIIAIAGIARKK